jgi:hypothetical protein
MIKRLEQLAALVVAAGLALVSYWLFFSWAQGGGVHRRQKPNSSSGAPHPPGMAAAPLSKPPAGFDQPLLGGTVIHPLKVVPHLLHRHDQTVASADLDDPVQGSARILERLAEEGLGEFVVFADLGVERGGIGG